MDAKIAEGWMRRAIAQSRKGFPAPNPHVGCLIVQQGVVVGEGWHNHAGGPHAEVVALRRAGPKAEGADVFVTLEPCAHYGRTPPCTEALIAAKVGRVFVAAADPNPLAAGGAEKLRAAGIETTLGVLTDEARAANNVFLHAMTRGRPYVVAKAAMTLDGRIAWPDGASQWITGTEARREGHRVRAEMGAVLVGRKTIERDDPLLTARIPGVRNQPKRWVLDPYRKLSDQYRCFQGPDPARRIVRAGAQLSDSDVVCPVVNGTFDLESLLGVMAQQGCIGLLVEGGARTVQSFAAQGFVDRFDLFLAPKLFGQGVHWHGEPWSGESSEGTFEQVRRFGNDVLLRYVPHLGASREHES